MLLMKAAGISSAELVLHRGTWEFLSALAADHGHFRTPPAVEDIKEGRIQAALSGRSLIAVLIELWNTRATATVQRPTGHWPPPPTTGSPPSSATSPASGDTIRIVLDDGLAHADGSKGC